MDRVHSVTGLMEEKQESLRQQGVFAQYAQVHSQYAGLIDHATEGIEALKRALFIQWFTVAEPACFTGIFDVAQEARDKVFKQIDGMIRRQELDDELGFMLDWYYNITPWYFDAQSECHNWQRYLATTHAAPQYENSQFDNRGQMGRYWQSVNHGPDRKRS